MASAVAEITKEVSRLLKRPAEALNQNFFDIGGNSVDAVELIAKVNSVFTTAITPTDIVTKTLEEIADMIEATRKT